MHVLTNRVAPLLNISGICHKAANPTGRGDGAPKPCRVGEADAPAPVPAAIAALRLRASMLRQSEDLRYDTQVRLKYATHSQQHPRARLFTWNLITIMTHGHSI